MAPIDKPFEAPAKRWWTPDTVAVVTGANKGIGYGIAIILANQGLKVVCAARDETRGQEAVQILKQETGSQNLVHEQLDVTDGASVSSFAQRLKQKYGGCTILINNAGLAFQKDIFGPKEANQTFDVNYWGVKSVIDAVAPLLKENGRIVTVSSRSGLRNRNVANSKQLRERFEGAQKTEEIDQLAKEFLQAVKAGTWEKEGWPRSMYGVSKLCCTAYMRLLAREPRFKDVPVTVCCPGYVDTDMTQHKGVKTLAQGADTPVWLALMPPGEAFTGELCAEREIIEW
eukprot:jgi/Astpho2/6173/e_gw1.00088.78.1_t